MRITEKQIEVSIDRLNVLTGNPSKPYSRNKANIGNYHLSCAYGGYALHQMINDCGGVNDIFNGYKTKRELFNLIHAFIAGIETKEILASQ